MLVTRKLSVQNIQRSQINRSQGLVGKAELNKKFRFVLKVQISSPNKILKVLREYYILILSSYFMVILNMDSIQKE